MSRPGLLDGNAATLASHPKSLGPVEKIGFFARQKRLTFARCGVIDPLSLDAYRAHGGYVGLEQALALGGAGIVDVVAKSGLRGRGGAGFPTGIKWKTVHDTPADQKYIVCNADEGDSATFADRMIMEGDPFVLIEGMTIAGIAVGATKGYIYIRSEYPHAIAVLRSAIDIARKAGVLGANVAGSKQAFDLGDPRRRRRLCLRRGNGAARKPRRPPRHRPRQAAAPCAPGPVRAADRDQQRADAGGGAVHPRRKARRPTPISAWGVRAAPCRSSLPATSSMAACSRPRSA